VTKKALEFENYAIADAKEEEKEYKHNRNYNQIFKTHAKNSLTHQKEELVKSTLLLILHKILLLNSRVVLF
jgi:hypothetical protein